MSTTESARTNKEPIKSHRQSSLIQGNVVAFVFRSIDLPSISSSSQRTILSSSSPNKSEKDDELISKPEQLLQAFIDANKNSLNRKLVESLNELRIFGWYTSYTLLLSGPSEDIEVLKKAWSQRILRNPKGFLLKDVGTVKDFVVEWIPHSQFISLTTALHDTVMELDRDGRCASRDAIVKYLKNVYHDVHIPTEDIIHKCLGRLIEQRKIYHDGVGYRALIDVSPVHQAKNPDKKRVECEGVPLKCSVKSSGNSKSDNGSVASNSVASKDHKCKSSRKVTLSDGSSKDERTSRPYSDEDRTRFNFPFFDHFLNSSNTTTKTIASTDKKQISPLATSSGKSAICNENNEKQDIKIIDISDRRSVLRHINSPNMREAKSVTTPPVSSKSGDQFQNQGPSNDRSPGRPYDKHSREMKPTKRSKPQRSRSFTDPSKHRMRSKNSKIADGDFPLRRVMGTEELRIISKSDLKEERERIECASDRCRNGKGDKHKKDKISRKKDPARLSSGKNAPLADDTFAKNVTTNCHNEKRENLSISTVSGKSTKLTIDSDTQSGTYASDASSPFQSKKRKDLLESSSEKNNNVESGMTYLCLTGKMRDEPLNVGNEAEVTENSLTKANGITKEKFNVNIEDSSIFDCVGNNSDGIVYRCEDDIGFEKCNFDSITIGYSV